MLQRSRLRMGFEKVLRELFSGETVKGRERERELESGKQVN